MVACPSVVRALPFTLCPKLSALSYYRSPLTLYFPHATFDSRSDLDVFFYRLPNTEY